MEEDDFEGDETALPAGQISCEICGSTQFSSQGGFYFCQVCNTQSQNAQQYVDREEFGRSQVATTFRERATRKIRTKKHKIANFEAFNCILKLMADRLIKVGFPMIVRDEIFRLWMKYLEKRKAIFISYSGQKVDYLKSLANRSHGKHCNCGLKKQGSLPPRKKRVKNFARSKSKVSTEEAFMSVTMSKRTRTAQRTKAMMADYSSQLSNIIGEAPEAHESSIPVNGTSINQRRACKLTKQSKAVLRAMRNHGLVRENVAYDILKPEICSFKSLLVIIFIAMRQAGFSVLMTDIARMVWTGVLYFTSLRRILGQACLTTSSAVDILLKNTSNSWHTEYSESIFNMLNFLEISDFHYPKFREFLPKFIDDFALPQEFECLIQQMQKTIPIDSDHFFSLEKVSIKGYRVLPEFLILSVIIVVLKLLFGIDDVTERYQSDFARKFNAILENHLGENRSIEYTKLFVIEDWLSYLRQRDAIFTSELANPIFYHTQHNPSPAQLNNLIDKYGGHKGENFERENEEHCRKEVQGMFARYARLNTEFEPTASPNYNLISLPQEELVHQYLTSYPKVLNSKFNISCIKPDFKKSRIDFILNPRKYVKALRNAGHRVKVLKGDARQYPNLKDLERDSIILFQPFKCFDDYLPKYFGSPSSLKFIMSVCTKILSGVTNDELINDKLVHLIDHVLLFYTKHLKGGVVSVFPYDMSDNEVISESDSD